MTQTHNPLVPPDVDLRDFSFIPLDVAEKALQAWLEKRESSGAAHA